MKRYTAYIGILISIVCVYLAFHKMDLKEIWNLIIHTNIVWFIVAILVALLSYIPRSHRWQVLLRPVKRVPFWDSFLVLTVGFMANSILPARIGELIRAYLIGKRQNISKSAGLATVVVERLLDIISALLILIATAIAFSIQSQMKSLIVTATLLSLPLLVLLILFSLFPDHFLIVLKVLPNKFRPKAKSLLLSFAEGSKSLHNPKLFALSFAESLFIWFTFALTQYVLFLAMDIPLGLGPAFLTTVLGAFAVAIPSSPGFVGTYHLAVVFSLHNILGVPKDTAGAYAILSHFTNFVPIIFLGLASLQGLRIGIKSLRIKDESPEDNPGNWKLS